MRIQPRKTYAQYDKEGKAMISNLILEMMKTDHEDLEDLIDYKSDRDSIFSRFVDLIDDGTLIFVFDGEAIQTHLYTPEGYVGL